MYPRMKISQSKWPKGQIGLQISGSLRLFLMRSIVKVLPLIYWLMANFFVTKRDLNFRTYGGEMNGSMIVARTNVFCVLIKIKCQWNMGYQLGFFCYQPYFINELLYSIVFKWHISYKINLKHTSWEILLLLCWKTWGIYCSEMDISSSSHLSYLLWDSLAIQWNTNTLTPHSYMKWGTFYCSVVQDWSGMIYSHSPSVCPHQWT